MNMTSNGSEAVSGANMRSFRAAKKAVALLLIAPLLGAAGVPETGLEGIGRQLSDNELSEMRGKFVAPEGISYFGVTMQTSWTGSDGITTVATLLFNVGFAGGAIGAPHLLVGWTRNCDGCGDPAMDVAAVDGSTVVPAGLNSVTGVVQSQNINGSDNFVQNGMSIAILPMSAVAAANTSGLTEVSSGSTETFEDGDMLHFIMEPGQLALALSEGDGDLVKQSVSSDMNQAAQHVLLNSSFNSVNNVLGITVGLSELQQFDRLQVQNAISAMKGNGF